MTRTGCDFTLIMAMLVKHIVAALLVQRPIYSKQAVNKKY